MKGERRVSDGQEDKGCTFSCLPSPGGEEVTLPTGDEKYVTSESAVG